VLPAVAISLLVAACGSNPSPSPTLPPATPSATAASSSPPSASPSPGASSPVAADPSLLEALPSSINGLDLQYTPDATEQAASNAVLAIGTEAIAYAVAADPESSDLVIAVVTRPREAAFNDIFFRAWRDSFDAAVCAQAGGVTGHAQEDVAGRTVYVGTCRELTTIYHAYLERRAVVVSVSSVGPGQLGEQLMGQLQD
jgi:hypothetical protein